MRKYENRTLTEYDLRYEIDFFTKIFLVVYFICPQIFIKFEYNLRFSILTMPSLNMGGPLFRNVKILKLYPPPLKSTIRNR